MRKAQKFGGAWTVEKLNIFSDYLNFYITALKNQNFGKIYIDAFAGTGQIEMSNTNETIEGSARLALNANNKFTKYIFIEKDKNKSTELYRVIHEEYAYCENITEVRAEDSNQALQDICSSTDWRYNRALLLLDPFATEVNWDTLKTVAATKAIDVWYLFPISAAQRMMKNNGNIPDAWKTRLNVIFGDASWESKFYIENPQLSFFDFCDEKIKKINTENLSNYICERLKTIFTAVAPNPRVLYNSKNSPMFLFCFATSSDSEKAQKLALKVANYILKK